MPELDTLDWTRIVTGLIGLGVLGYAVHVVATTWNTMTFYVRMFSMSYIALVLAPVTGVIERLLLGTPHYWADTIFFVSIGWVGIGLWGAVVNRDTEMHACPHCGKQHLVRLPYDTGLPPVPEGPDKP